MTMRPARDPYFRSAILANIDEYLVERDEADLPLADTSIWDYLTQEEKEALES